MGFCILTNNIDTSLVEDLDQSVRALRDSKQDVLVSGENIKKINGQDLIGSGNIKFTVNNKDFNASGNVDIDVGVTQINGIKPTGGNITLKKVNNTQIVGDGNIDVGVTKITANKSSLSGDVTFIAGTNIKAFDVSGNNITINGSNTAVEFTSGALLTVITNNPNYNTFFRVQTGSASITDFPKGFEKSEAAISLVRTDARITATLVTYNSSGKAKVFTRDIIKRDGKYQWLNDWTWSSAPVLIWKNPTPSGTFNNRIFKESDLNMSIKYFKFLILTFKTHKNNAPIVTFITPNNGQVWLSTTIWGDELTYCGRVIQFNPNAKTTEAMINCQGPVDKDYPDGFWHSWYWTAASGFKTRYRNNDYMILQEIYGLTGLVD